MNLDELVSAIRSFDKSDIAALKDLVDNHDEIILIGNGGSNAICSHIAQDYTKQLYKRAYSFSDPSRLTCYINDYGRDDAYAQFLVDFATHPNNRVAVILVSSSGNSENVYRCVGVCQDLDLPFVILTGFQADNRLRKDFGGDAFLNIWVDSTDYGIVECAHQVFLHAILGDE